MKLALYRRQEVYTRSQAIVALLDFDLLLRVLVSHLFCRDKSPGMTLIAQYAVHGP